ncbi:segregation and condensation protein A [Lacticaseibacillus brantae]|uniref:Segregation and condensation protein A n=1 Tax=Lacticaseibacillus brantae DSM 23927 TaxID=1423727 RepID=A0A0R2AZR2_9LACO|nr:segregation/condensation protein A [Lacticaseibacillus brantae]KRM72592.1 hypothetical protein FC34_GL000301 [Lacticaseibacillus brantae DSM 23927]
MVLTLKLDQFSGPLDLLWHLIKANEVDIYDIPIADITQQYLDYLHQMQVLSLDVAGDYFVMAASLMALKSKLLLPQPEPELVEDFEDPRADLVQQLLTYQAFQQAASQLQDLAHERAQAFAKPVSLPPADATMSIAPGAVKLREVTKAMQAVVNRRLSVAETVQHITTEATSVAEQIDYILQKLKASHHCDFEALLVREDIPGIISTFLAVLELMKLDQIVCEQQDPFSGIDVYLKEAS